jgi:hypothetical protein
MKTEDRVAKDNGIRPDASEGSKKEKRKDQLRNLTGANLINACKEWNLFGVFANAAARMADFHVLFEAADEKARNGAPMEEVNDAINAAEDAFFDTKCFNEAEDDDLKHDLTNALDYEDRVGWSPKGISVTTFYTCAMKDPNSWNNQLCGHCLPGKLRKKKGADPLTCDKWYCGVEK